MTASDLLRRVPGVYADLVDAALPGRTGEPSSGRCDPTNRPAPGNLDVIDHRHQLVRGLRWWVDAVHDGPAPRVGHSVPAMCRSLLADLDVMDPDDVATLATNLSDWLATAREYLGAGDTAPPALPAGAADAVVRVADAARLLGVSVRTVQRRAARADGLVRLGDVTR